tara:strand:+ start:62998 stop:64023 length:1026 start_codon:yes stop_codon:yes gene_type:complete
MEDLTEANEPMFNTYDALVCGAGGFIGGHLVKFLVNKGFRVAAVDIKPLDEWWQADTSGRVHNIDNTDLTLRENCDRIIEQIKPEEVFNLACNMGGIGFITDYKADCMLNVLINTHLLDACARIHKPNKYFYASSACIYGNKKTDLDNGKGLTEDMAYPAEAEDGYGWEKLFSERMCLNFMEDHGIPVYVARFHAIYGPHGSWTGGREKVPAAISRKVAEVEGESGSIEVWGDGKQRRTFCYIADAIEGIWRLTRSDFHEPINIGSDEIYTIDEFVDLVAEIAGKNIEKQHVEGATGADGRASDNTLIQKVLGWSPSISTREGMTLTYQWVAEQVKQTAKA